MVWNSSIIKKGLLGVVFAILFLPLAQNNLHLFKVKNLNGYFVPAQDIDLSKVLWFTGGFQESKEKYLNDNFGLRNTAVRLLNQINFMCFKTASGPEAVVGKENYLYTKIYIESYNGENFIGAEAVIKKSFLVKELQDRLKERGKIFLPVIAPNKAYAISEYLPYGNVRKGVTNYDAFKYCFDKLKIKYIDFESYFVNNYKSSKYPLFSKYGIHWSSYGHFLAADSLINYLNYHYNLNTNTLLWKNTIELSDSLRDFDYDIGAGMNLFVDQLPSQKLAYPKFQYTQKTTKKPRLLVIGDSFNFGLEKTDMQNQAFCDYKLLYYFKEIVPATDDKDAFFKLNIKDEIENHDVITVLFTEQNFVHYGCGFIEKALNILDGKDNGMMDDSENKVIEMINNIKSDAVWFAKIKEEALLEHKNIDDLLRENAVYMINLKKEEERQLKTKKVNEMIEYIKNNAAWIKLLEQKAKENNVPLDSLIYKDAVFQVEANK